jgi:hypothetical protein
LNERRSATGQTAIWLRGQIWLYAANNAWSVLQGLLPLIALLLLWQVLGHPR